MNSKIGGCLLWILIIVSAVFWIRSCQSKNDSPSSNQNSEPKQEIKKTEITVKTKPQPIEISIDLQTSIIYNRVRLVGFSNLPGGVRLMFSIYNSKGTPIAHDHGITDKHGNFSSSIFFEKNGLPNGEYRGEVLMTAASSQTSEVQAIIGEKGEMLVGKFVSAEKYGGGNIVSASVPFNIDLEVEIKKEKEFHENRKKMIARVILSSCMLLDELLNFKDSEDFAFYGFGVGGPYNSWIQKVKKLEKKMDNIPLASSLPPSFRTVPGHLLQIGMEFMRSKGKTTSYTEEYLPQVKTAIMFDEYLKFKN